MAEQQQDEVGPASAFAWSKGSRASGGWRGHGRRARDATGRRRDEVNDELEKELQRGSRRGRRRGKASEEACEGAMAAG